MNHQPFEEWLLADEPPVGEQAIELREHLRDCQHCRELEASWASVHKLFTTSAQIAPASGFTARWQTRLQAQQAETLKLRRHRRPWLMFTLNFIIAVLLLTLLGLQLYQAFNSPQQLLLIKAFLLSIVLTIVNAGQDILNASVQLIGRFPVLLWVLLLGFSGFLGSLWMTVGRQLASTRRVTL